MRIGIDFDNTIVDYSGVFHAAALERGLIPAGLETSRTAVRDYLNGRGQKDAFTELQGYVYGARMALARCYPGVRDFIAAALADGHSVFIVSHKTPRPLLGPAYDLHAAAQGFLEANGFFAAGLLAPGDSHFEASKEAKVARVAALRLDAFIDDLPEILAAPGFPAATRRLLFAPDGPPAALPAGTETYRTWPAIGEALLPRP